MKRFLEILDWILSGGLTSVIMDVVLALLMIGGAPDDLDDMGTHLNDRRDDF